MGAREYYKSVKGYDNPTEAFNALVEEEVRRNGDDIYSGSLNHGCHLSRMVKKYERTPKQTEIKKRNAEISKLVNNYMEDSDKGCIGCIDLGVEQYQVVSVKKVKVKGATPKFEKVYSVYSDEGKRLAKGKNLSEMTAKLLTFASDNPGCELRTEYVCTSGNNTLYSTKRTTKAYKTKPKNVPKSAVLKEIHTYIFFGWVRE